MKNRTGLTAIIVLIVAMMSITEMYVPWYEWLIIIMLSTTITFVFASFVGFESSRKRILLSFLSVAVYLILFSIDTVWDYNVLAFLRRGPIDGAIPPLTEVISEAFDDFGLMNFFLPSLVTFILLTVVGNKQR